MRPFQHMQALLFCVGLLLVSTGPSAADAHNKHHSAHGHAGPVSQTPAHGEQAGAAGRTSAMTVDHDTMGEAMEEGGEDRSKMSFAERLLDWIGRLHPAIVHFPLAFFPAAAFTAVIGRRRPGFGTPVRFLTISGGTIAPLAAVMGWLDAVGEEPSTLLTVHRWLGTGIGIAGLLLATWAWRRPDQDRSPGMVAALLAVTGAIIIQGWYGGAIVHGIDHLNW